MSKCIGYDAIIFDTPNGIPAIISLPATDYDTAKAMLSVMPVLEGNHLLIGVVHAA